MGLEIRVIDSTQAVDALPQSLDAGLKIIEAVAKAIDNWIATDMKDPLIITIKQQEATGPPTNIGINIGDGTRVGDHLG